MHDTEQQHLQALKSMNYEASGPFITSMLELKPHAGTMAETQQQLYELSSLQQSTWICEPPCFAFWAYCLWDSPRRVTNIKVHWNFHGKPAANYDANASSSTKEPCSICKTERHSHSSPTPSSNHNLMIAWWSQWRQTVCAWTVSSLSISSESASCCTSAKNA